MRIKNVKKIVIALLGLVVLACQAPIVPGGKQSGTVRLSLQAASRTLGPQISLDVKTYQIEFRTPSGGLQSYNLSGSETDLEPVDLVPGNWNLLVLALNDKGFLLGRGGADFKLNPGEDKALTLTLGPESGNGTLDFSADLSALPGAVLEVSLTGAGSTQESPLTLVSSAGLLKNSQTSFPAGYYHLHGRIVDRKSVV